MSMRTSEGGSGPLQRLSSRTFRGRGRGGRTPMHQDVHDTDTPLRELALQAPPDVNTPFTQRLQVHHAAARKKGANTSEPLAAVSCSANTCWHLACNCAKETRYCDAAGHHEGTFVPKLDNTLAAPTQQPAKVNGEASVSLLRAALCLLYILHIGVALSSMHLVTALHSNQTQAAVCKTMPQTS